MAGIAFYAPMKPPDDAVPSGDRTMARALIAALEGTSLGDLRLMSRLRSRDREGRQDAQDAIFRAADDEIARLADEQPPALWLTYHSYYKAPDLLGPVLSRHWGIPYALVEGTRDPRRLQGPYAQFAAAAERACDAADIIFYLTEHDRFPLERDRAGGQLIAHLRPFLNRETIEPLGSRSSDGTIRLLACGMLRRGDKLASYTALAAALAFARPASWTLTVIGDGPARADVQALFAEYGDRVTFLGALSQDQVARQMREADLLVWPGVGEAFGMVYLEAQAEGCPCLAEDRWGVRDVVRSGGRLTPPGDSKAFGRAIDDLAKDVGARLEMGRKGREHIAAEHLLGSARATLAAALGPLIEDGRS